MSKGLFMVRAVIETVVYAEDEDDARDLALREAFYDEVGKLEDPLLSVVPVLREADLPHGYDAQCVPYSDDELTAPRIADVLIRDCSAAPKVDE